MSEGMSHKLNKGFQHENGKEQVMQAGQGRWQVLVVRHPTPTSILSRRYLPGQHPFPLCSTQNIDVALTLFLEGSYFNGDLSQGKCRRYADDVRCLWADLDGKKRFPLSELVEARMTLRSLL
jgi:hypothetical protein